MTPSAKPQGANRHLRRLVQAATPLQAFALGHLFRRTNLKQREAPPGGWTLAAMQVATWEDVNEFLRQLKKADEA